VRPEAPPSRFSFGNRLRSFFRARQGPASAEPIPEPAIVHVAPPTPAAGKDEHATGPAGPPSDRTLIDVSEGWVSRATPEDHGKPAKPPDAPAVPPPPSRLDDHVQFTVYRPKVVRPERWYALLVFTHLAERRPDAPEGQPDPIALVKERAKRLLAGEEAEHRESTHDGPMAIPHGGMLTFVPEISGVEFNPPRQSVLWAEDVHQVGFRLRAARALDGHTASGRLSIYLGGILFADVGLVFRVDANDRAATSGTTPEQVRARPYRKIFASYSHRDVDVVRQVESYAKMIGDEFVRDATHLRAGEFWGDQLMRLIREADVFQLFWSKHSMVSPHVRREWEYALSLDRPSFVRPTYWEEPLPSLKDEGLPPEELLRLHFHFQPIHPTLRRRRTPAILPGLLVGAVLLALAVVLLLLRR
jgi:hypothetical protein